MLEIHIPMETPSKKNSKIMNTKTHRMFPSKKYTEWHNLSSMFINQRIRKMYEKCYIILVFTHGDLIKRDADNGTSSIFDTLKDCNAIVDDNWMVVKSHHVFNNFNKKLPECEILVFGEEEKELYKNKLIEYSEKYF